MYNFLFDDAKVMFTFLLIKNKNISAFHRLDLLFDTWWKTFYLNDLMNNIYTKEITVIKKHFVEH